MSQRIEKSQLKILSGILLQIQWNGDSNYQTLCFCVTFESHQLLTFIGWSRELNQRFRMISGDIVHVVKLNTNMIRWGGPFTYLIVFAPGFLTIAVKASLIHGLGIRKTRMQLANCRPRIQRRNSVHRNAITVFLQAKKRFQVSDPPGFYRRDTHGDFTRRCFLIDLSNLFVTCNYALVKLVSTSPIITYNCRWLQCNYPKFGINVSKKCCFCDNANDIHTFLIVRAHNKLSNFLSLHGENNLLDLLSP